jgi:deoxyuridine 5'-triphosphate nucleotidohydrolase
MANPTYRLELMVTEQGAQFYPPVGTKEALTGENAGYDLKIVASQPPTSIATLAPLGIKARMVRSVEQVVPGNSTETSQIEVIVVKDDCHFSLEPRSSIYKTGLIMANSRGIIDKSYRGELKAPVISVGTNFKTVDAGTRLFQIVAPDMGYINEVEYVNFLPDTVRGEGGFGSTGTM